MTNTEQKVKEIILEQKGDVEIEVDEDITKIGYNSIEFIKLVISLEKEFDIEFDDEFLDYNKLNTIQKIAECIDNMLT